MRVPATQGTTLSRQPLASDDGFTRAASALGVLADDREGESLPVRDRLDPLQALGAGERRGAVRVRGDRRDAVLGEVAELHRGRRVGTRGEAELRADRPRERLAEAGVDVALP